VNSVGGVWVDGRRSGEQLVTELYAQFKGGLHAHVLGLTNHDRQWTEDVVQETLIRAWQNAETLVRDPRMLRGWLLTVARRRSRPQEVELTSPDTVGVADETDQRLSAMVINDVIGRLGEEHRAAIYETYVRGRTVREAALVLGIPEGTVKSRVYNAMKILRRALREWN
jgi:RNA polymerase sigma-70 factor (ECF subfamily)